MLDPNDARQALVLIGHGTKSEEGTAEFWQFVEVVAKARPSLVCTAGFIEAARPTLQEAFSEAVSLGSDGAVGVPLVLLGAGHMKLDGAAAVQQAGAAGTGGGFGYASALGIHPLVVGPAAERAKAASAGFPPDSSAVVLVGRGSTDPDANADLFKVARLLEDPYGLRGVEACFVSLRPPSVSDALDRCFRLGASHIAVVPYFLFDGILVQRIGRQAATWQQSHPSVHLEVAPHLGPDPSIAKLVLERFDEAIRGEATSNCDMCAYRTPLPGYEERVGQPLTNHHHPHHD